MNSDHLGSSKGTAENLAEVGETRQRFAWMPIPRYSSEFYRNGSYWLRTVTERRPGGRNAFGQFWKAFEADNEPG